MKTSIILISAHPPSTAADVRAGVSEAMRLLDDARVSDGSLPSFFDCCGVGRSKHAT